MFYLALFKLTVMYWSLYIYDTIYSRFSSSVMHSIKTSKADCNYGHFRFFFFLDYFKNREGRPFSLKSTGILWL